jgi:hypothetical protein
MMMQLDLNFDVPDWASYCATDENGDVCVYEDKPFIIDNIVGEGIFETKTNFMVIAKNCVSSNWKESLIEL